MAISRLPADVSDVVMNSRIWSRVGRPGAGQAGLRVVDRSELLDHRGERFLLGALETKEFGLELCQWRLRRLPNFSDEL